MGAKCSISWCSPKDSVNDIVPDTETMKSIRSNSPKRAEFDSHSSEHSNLASPSSPSPPSPPTPNPDDTAELISDFRDAVIQGSNTMVMFLQDENPEIDLVHHKDENGDSVLIEAVKNQRYDVIEYLLESQVSVNQQNKSGNTALHYAARNGDIRAVKLLQEFHADAHIKNNDQETPILIANELKLKKIVKIMGGLTKHDLISEDVPSFTQIAAKKSNGRHRSSTELRENTQRLEHFTDDVLLSSPDVGLPHNNDYLQSMNTNRLTSVADDIFSDLQYSATLKKKSLFALEGWFEKKGKFGYSKWWVMLKDDYLLWNDRQIRVGEAGVTESEKQRWDVCVKLVNITEVSRITQGKTQRKFKMKIGKKKDIIWRVKDSASRDSIVKNLNNHITVRQQEILYSSGNSD